MPPLRPLVLSCSLLLGPACDSSSGESNRAPKTAEDSKPSEKGTPTRSSEAKPSGENTRIVNVPVGGDLNEVLAEHATKAKAAGLKPHVELWAQWCSPCKAIEKSMGDPRMQKAFAGVYLIRLDADQWGDKLGNTGMSAATIPVFYELDAAGQTTGRSIDGGAWGDNIPENMAPPLDAYFHSDEA